MDVRSHRDRPGVLTVGVENVSRWDEQAVRTLDALGAVGRAVTGDVRVIVVEFGTVTESPDSTAEGFLRALASLSETECDAVLTGYQDAAGWLRRADTITLATARGALAGPALDLALNCDLRLLAQDASLTFGAPPLLGVTDRLASLLGAGRAVELTLLGRTVGAADAQRLGLATDVVPGSDLDAATDELVTALLAADRGAQAETKALYEAPSPAAERAAFARRARAGYGSTD